MTPVDVRAPTHEPTIARDVLRTRRRIAAQPPGWALSTDGLRSLRGQESEDAADAASDEGASVRQPAPAATAGAGEGEAAMLQADDAFAANLAESTRCWFGRRRRSPKPRRPAETAGGTRNRWSTISIGTGMDASPSGAPSLRKPTVCDRCCRRSSPRRLERSAGAAARAWLGRLLAAETLRQAGVTTGAHFDAVNLGLKPSPLSVAAIARAIQGRWRSSTASSRPPLGLKEHDRLALARTMMERRLVGRRSSSHLPGLVELVMSRPLVSAGMVAEALEVTPRAALRIVEEPGSREMTGRGRFRAWAVI
ncbi:hypothetical protein RCCGEPOP_24682 [Rhizobium sp. Pop5]|nr:hypothetical protein RCCGEPOP_24682 [Rhizobium sp. Pop5]